MDITSPDQGLTCAFKAKIKHISRLLTQEEIAAITRVSQEDVDLFERNQPINPVAKRKLLDAYFFKGTINQYLSKRFWG